MKWIAGIAQQRAIPRYAEETFVEWFRRRERKNGGRRVVLWPDTFNNYFRRETAIAATHVLENLGFSVVVPDGARCCGRPLYDWGMLDSAQRLWRRTMSELRSEIELGTPIVGLEPACVSAFRDELPGLFPQDASAQRLSRQALFFSEFIERNAPDAPLPHIARSALVQIHCHHHSVIKPQSEQRVLDRLGLDYELLPSGCCGMAGSFGFESEKYDVSMTAAERVLLPRLRAAAVDTIVLANGFSCREQIEQATGHKTSHLAELISQAC
jgi:Fe-S oxidoreductase